VKHAILATVVNVERKCLDSVLVRLESDELRKTTEVVSAGLNGEQSRTNAESSVEVICEGDPGAEAGDKVPIIINVPVRQVSSMAQSRILAVGAKQLKDFAKTKRKKVPSKKR
jgi:hypothetical protein